MADRSVRDQIVDNLHAAIAAIDGTGVYHHAIAQVFRWRTPPPAHLEFPSAVVIDTEERVELQIPLEDRRLSVTVQVIGHGSFEDSGDEGPDDLAREMLADVERAAQVDTTRGGLAVVTIETANRIAVDVPAEPYFVVEVDFEIRYRTAWGDPATEHAG